MDYWLNVFARDVRYVIPWIETNICNLQPVTLKDNERYQHRILYVVKGKCRYTLRSGREIEARPGDILYIPGNYGHTVQWQTLHNKIIELVYRCDKGDYALNSAGVYDVCVLHDEIEIITHDDDGHFLSALYKYYEFYQNYDKQSIDENIRLKYLWMDFFVDLYHHDRSMKRNNFCSIETVANLIESKYYENSKELSVENLAKLCALSPSQFRANFKREIGMSPIKYKNQLRMNKAKELIESGESIKYAANSVGFEDYAHFNKLFHAFFHCNPSDCKKSAIGSKPPQTP